MLDRDKKKQNEQSTDGRNCLCKNGENAERLLKGSPVAFLAPLARGRFAEGLFSAEH